MLHRVCRRGSRAFRSSPEGSHPPKGPSLHLRTLRWAKPQWSVDHDLVQDRKTCLSSRHNDTAQGPQDEQQRRLLFYSAGSKTQEVHDSRLGGHGLHSASHKKK